MTIPGPSSQLMIDELRPVFRASVERKVAKSMRLFRFQQKEGERRGWIETEVGIRRPGIPMNIEEIGKGVCQFQPKKPLKPGEYGIVKDVKPGSWLLRPTRFRVAEFTIRGPSAEK